MTIRTKTFYKLDAFDIIEMELSDDRPGGDRDHGWDAFCTFCGEFAATLVTEVQAREAAKDHLCEGPAWMQQDPPK